MRKIKNHLIFITSSLVLVIAAVVSFSFFTIAKAEQNQKIGENSASTTKNASDDKSKVEADENKNSTDEDVDNEEKDDEQFDNEEHLNKEEDFRHGLLEVADREDHDEDKKDGEEIREIAYEQEKSASTTVHTIKKIEHRNKIQTFLFGTDYKNLGALRSDIVQTRNRLDKLDKLAEGLQNATDTLKIQVQSQTMEQEMTKLENFIKEQENKFSLFGWLIKMFNQ